MNILSLIGIVNRVLEYACLRIVINTHNNTFFCFLSTKVQNQIEIKYIFRNYDEMQVVDRSYVIILVQSQSVTIYTQ